MESTRRGILISGLSALLPIRLLPAAAPADGERRQPFNDGWRFFKGEAGGAEQAAFDDSKWRDVRLPHDWAIEGPFDPKLNPHTGALPISGTGWYRKALHAPLQRPGPLLQHRVRRRDVELQGLAQRPGTGRPPIRL